MRDAPKVVAPAVALLIVMLLPLNPYIQFQALIIAALSMAVLGVLLLLPAGLINFGQGATVVLGGYATAWLLNSLGAGDVVLGVLSGAALGAVFHAAVGPGVLRFRGTIFALFMISLSMILYGVMVSPGAQPLTGGSDGIYVNAPGTLTVSAAAAALLVIATYLRTLMDRSSLGLVIRGIGSNELRVRMLGIRPIKPLYVAFLFSGALAGVSGALVAMATQHISPQYAYWAPSSELAIAALLGRLLARGPLSAYDFLIGAALLEAAYAAAYMLSLKLTLAMGAILVAVILMWRLGERRWRS